MFTSIHQSWSNVCSDSANVKVQYYPVKKLMSYPVQKLMGRHSFTGSGNFLKFLQELIPELFYLPEMLTNHNKVGSYIRI